MRGTVRLGQGDRGQDSFPLGSEQDLINGPTQCHRTQRPGVRGSAVSPRRFPATAGRRRRQSIQMGSASIQAPGGCRSDQGASWPSSRTPLCGQPQVDRQFNRAAFLCNANLILRARKRDLNRLVLKISQAELHLTRNGIIRTREWSERSLAELVTIEVYGQVPVTNKPCKSMRVRYYLSPLVSR